MNVLDLFSGIGGFSLGLERAGMRTVAFCERDAFCRAVLRRHWPAVPIFDDVRELDATRLGRLGHIDLVCGGFPCQPFSVAGNHKAHADDRHLWPAMREVIALTGSPWVLGENVAGILALALDDVLLDLETLGYTSRTFVIPACGVGAPHRRDRVWIVAHANSSALRDHQQRRARRRHDVPDRRETEPFHDGTERPVADTDGGRLQKFGLEEHGHQQSALRSELDGCGARRSGDGSQRFDWWTFEPDVGRMAHGVPRRMDRLRALGNAVVPQLVEEIGRAIMSAHTATAARKQCG